MLSEYFFLAFKNLKKRGIRSWLTMLGIFIGIAAVVSLISLGQGLETAITGQFKRRNGVWSSWLNSSQKTNCTRSKNCRKRFRCRNRSAKINPNRKSRIQQRSQIQLSRFNARRQKTNRFHCGIGKH
jgi:ABC-type antimicrobial peptide transport system permease subunit